MNFENSDFAVPINNYSLFLLFCCNQARVLSPSFANQLPPKDRFTRTQMMHRKSLDPRDRTLDERKSRPIHARAMRDDIFHVTLFVCIRSVVGIRIREVRTFPPTSGPVTCVTWHTLSYREDEKFGRFDQSGCIM